MSKENIKILLADDDEDDYTLTRDLLSEVQEFRCDLKWVNSSNAALEAIEHHDYDVYLLDYRLDELTGLDLLREITERGFRAPAILLTSQGDRDVDLKAMEAGASDYLIKGQVDASLLGRSIRYAIMRKRSEEFTRHILESMDQGLIVVDREYRILTANRAYSDLVQSPIKDIIGRHCYEVSHLNDKPCHRLGEVCAVKITFETGRSESAVHTHTTCQGDPAYMEIKSYPMKDTSGLVTSVIEVIKDITEKRKLEEQFRHVQKMEAVGTLTGGVAHEFNNILTAIRGYADLSKLDLGEGSPVAVYIDQILDSSERAANLTQSLLAFSRKQLIQTEPVELNEIILRMERLMARLIGEDIELQTFLAEEKLTILADSGHIEQVLVNMVINARDAMPQGGKLTINTERFDMNGEAACEGFPGSSGAYVIISVSDTGKGMDEKTTGKIFEPFFTTKEVGKGTGLGLSLAYGVVKQHNGHIDVSSEPGKGTTFKIYLPLVKDEVHECRAIEPDFSEGGTETLLIAEDEDKVRKIYKTVLEKYGYTVIEAVDGEEAVTRFMEHKDAVDLLLLDMVMPKKNGKEVFEHAVSVKPGIKALFASGYAADMIEQGGISRKEVGILSKPFSTHELLKKLREVLEE